MVGRTPGGGCIHSRLLPVTKGRSRPNADADQNLAKGRALARPSERSERFEPVAMHVLLAVSLNDTG